MLIENKVALKNVVEAFGLSSLQREQFELYVELLEPWARRTNLVSKNDRPKIVSRHIVESLEITKHSLIRNGSLLDLGTGAGFPGVPLSIFYPNLHVTCLDSRRIKTLFLKEFIEKVALKNIDVTCARIEDISSENGYNYITARAVARLNRLWSWSERLLFTGGVLVAFKGGNIDDEVNELINDFDVSCEIFPFADQDVPDSPERKLVVVSRQ